MTSDTPLRGDQTRGEFSSNEQFLHRLPCNSENATASRTNSNLELRSSGALANRGTQPGLIHMKLFSFGA
jgi:hypothetical protein